MANESSKSSSSRKDELGPEQLSMSEVKQAQEELDEYIRSGKREHLSLTVPKFLDECANDEFHHLSEDGVRAAGTEWKLLAVKKAGRFILSLIAISTLERVVHFEVDYSFRLFNAYPSKDNHKAGRDLCAETGKRGHLLIQGIELKDLVEEGFVREDGSIHMDIDFAIVKATIKGLPEVREGAESSSKK